MTELSTGMFYFKIWLRCYTFGNMLSRFKIKIYQLYYFMFTLELYV